MNKKLDAALLKGDQAVVIDEIVGKNIDSSELRGALTSGATTEVRVLGESRQVSVNAKRCFTGGSISRSTQAQGLARKVGMLKFKSKVSEGKKQKEGNLY